MDFRVFQGVMLLFQENSESYKYFEEAYARAILLPSPAVTPNAP